MKKFIFMVLLTLIVFPSLMCSRAFALSPIDVTYSDGIYHIVVGQDRAKKKVKVYSSPSLITNKELHTKSEAELTINAGYFDPKSGDSVSYTVMDWHTVDDPRLSPALMSNPVLRKNLSKILNRTEFRIVECDGNKYHYDIAPHNDAIDFNCSVKEAVQAGPMILPQLRLEEEFFIEKKDGVIVRESCSVLHKVARTILGIKDGNLHILIITDDNPMDLYEVQALCKELGFEKAMGLDGGSSTSMDYRNKYHVESLKGDGNGRMLKSFITVFK